MRKTIYSLLVAMLAASGALALTEAQVVEPVSEQESQLACQTTGAEQTLASSLELLPARGQIVNFFSSPNQVICNMMTCECFDCTVGQGCVPVPPPTWCIPI